MEEFTKAAQLNPLSWIVNKYLSSLYWQKGDLNKSLKHYVLGTQSSNLLTSYSSHYEFLKLIEAVRSYTMLSQARLFSLYALAKQICLDDIPGNFVECGTWRGGTVVGKLTKVEWQALRKEISSKISIESENSQLIEEAEMADLPVWKIQSNFE